MPIKDPEKRREYRRKWYAKNRESEIKHIRRRRLEIKKWFIDYKKKLSCKKCGENHFATLEFHHKNGHDKVGHVGMMVNDGFSIDKLLEEISKCEVLCANCHRKLHFNAHDKT